MPFVYSTYYHTQMIPVWFDSCFGFEMNKVKKCDNSIRYRPTVKYS